MLCALHPAPRSGEGGPRLRSKVVEGASASKRASAAACPLHHPSGGPPPPRCARWRILIKTATAPPTPSASRATTARAAAGRRLPPSPIRPATARFCAPSNKDAGRGNAAHGGSAPWRNRANSRATCTAPAPDKRGGSGTAARSIAYSVIRRGNGQSGAVTFRRIRVFSFSGDAL